MFVVKDSMMDVLLQQKILLLEHYYFVINIIQRINQIGFVIAPSAAEPTREAYFANAPEV